MALPTGANTSITLGGASFNLDMVPVYIKKKLLQIAMKKVVFHQLGDKEDLPQGQGKTVRFIRYERFGLPLIPLTEGDTPTEYRQMVVTPIEAVVDQWGDVGVITDVAELTVYHKALQIMIDRFALQAAETADREDQRVLLGGTNVLYPDKAHDSRDDLIATDYMNTDVIRRALAALRNTGAPDFSGDFIGVIDPYVEMDLTKDPTFVTAASYSAVTKLMNGEVGKWMGVRWMRSNHIPYIVRNTTNTAVTGATSPAADASETALATPAGGLGYVYKITGLDSQGFETQLGAEATVAFTAGDIIQIILPAPSGPVVAYNIYMRDENVASQTLQAEAVGAGTYRLHLGSSTAVAGATSVTFGTSGRVAPVTPTGTVKVHQSYIFGREAFGVVELTNIQTTLTQPVATDSDPLKQRRKAGWKYIYKAVIKNPNFFQRIESASDFD